MQLAQDIYSNNYNTVDLELQTIKPTIIMNLNTHYPHAQSVFGSTPSCIITHTPSAQLRVSQSIRLQQRCQPRQMTCMSHNIVHSISNNYQSWLRPDKLSQTCMLTLWCTIQHHIILLSKIQQGFIQWGRGWGERDGGQGRSFPSKLPSFPP